MVSRAALPMVEIGIGGDGQGVAWGVPTQLSRLCPIRNTYTYKKRRFFMPAIFFSSEIYSKCFSYESPASGGYVRKHDLPVVKKSVFWMFRTF